MPVHPLEQLADAIMRYSGYTNPEGHLYAARNPGGLKPTSMNHTVDGHGNRVYDSFVKGYQSLLSDLEIKLSGRSWAGLTPDSTLEELATSYGKEYTLADAWCKQLRKTLNDTTINRATTLRKFL